MPRPRDEGQSCGSQRPDRNCKVLLQGSMVVINPAMDFGPTLCSDEV